MSQHKSSEGEGIRLPCGHDVIQIDQPHYCSYIALEPLTALSQVAFWDTPQERPFHNHDEGLFVVVHQISEISFSRVILRLELTRAALSEEDLDVASDHLNRAVAWLSHATETIKMLFQMDTSLFMEPGVGFRDLVVPASGAESIRAREIEVLAGMRADSPYMRIGPHEFTFRQAMDVAPGLHDRGSRWWTPSIERRAQEPSVWSTLCDVLSQRGLSLDAAFKLDRQEGIGQIIAGLWRFEKTMLAFRKSHMHLTAEHFGVAHRRGFVNQSPDEVRGTGADIKSAKPSPQETPIPSAMKYLGAIYKTARLFPELFEYMKDKDHTLSEL